MNAVAIFIIGFIIGGVCVTMICAEVILNKVIEKFNVKK